MSSRWRPVAATRRQLVVRTHAGPHGQHQCARVSLPTESGRDVQRLLETQHGLLGKSEILQNVRRWTGPETEESILRRGC